MTALRVLVVEDEAIIGMLLAALLGEMGHAVCAVVATEAEAVAAAAREKPDLMIVDAGLGRGSGIRAVTAILRTGFVPHVFVSGSPLTGQALDPRAVVMLKPYAEPDIVRAVAKAMAPNAKRKDRKP
jgi:CheY-like chemotaxis protein